jgi:hypothetical protein
VQGLAHQRGVLGGHEHLVAVAEPQLAHAETERIADVRGLEAVAVGERERRPRERRTKDGSRRQRRDDAEATAHGAYMADLKTGTVS